MRVELLPLTWKTNARGKVCHTPLGMIRAYPYRKGIGVTFNEKFLGWYPDEAEAMKGAHTVIQGYIQSMTIIMEDPT